MAWLSFSFSKDQRLTFILSIIVIIIFLFVIIYLRSRERDFYFIPLNKPEHKDDWIGNGQFEYLRTNNSFQITHADPGVIYSKCLNWSDYKFNFEFKIRNTCLGAILRAVNLSNYIMIQITQNGIRPHLRINGGWRVWESKDVDLEFINKLSKEKLYYCELICDKNVINIKIYLKKELLFDREWIIPSGVIVFSFKREENDPHPVNIPFPINLEYGSAGFRASGDEKTLIKNVLLKKL